MLIVVVVVVDRLIWMGYGLIFFYIFKEVLVVVVVRVVVVGYTSFNGKHMQQTAINFQRFRT